MAPKRILFITSEFPPQPGGIGNHAYNLAKGLQKNGYEVKVLCDNRSLNGLEEIAFDKNLDFKVVRISRKKIIFFTYLSRIQSAFSIGRNSDILICSGKFSLWLGGFLSLFLKKKFIAIVHGNEVIISNPIFHFLTDRSLKRFDFIIAVSNYTKSLIAHLDLKNVEVIYNGFENKITPLPIKKNNPVPVLITVGNVTQRKGQHNIINALPLLLKKYPDLKYKLVGIPTEKNSLEKLALDLGVEEAIIFKGQVSEEDKMQSLQQADVFVMLSESTGKGDVEGFGIAILEANALGIPAIGALGCGIEDAISEGVSGRLIDPKNSQQLLDALEEILNEYQNYSKEAIDWSKNFTWDKVIKDYLKVLEYTDNDIFIN